MHYRFNPTQSPEIRTIPPGAQARVDAFFAGLGQGVNADGLRRARRVQLLQMEAKSDGELAALGLKRDDIPAFVFADLIA